MNKVILVTLPSGKKLVCKDEETMFVTLEKIATKDFECGWDDVEHENHDISKGIAVETTFFGNESVSAFVMATCVSDDDVELNEQDLLYADFYEVDFVG